MAEETWRTPHMLELSIPARGPAGSTEGRAQAERVLHAPARDGADDLRELGATLDSALPAAEAPALDVALLEKRELEVAMKDRELELLRKEAELLRKERELKALRLKLGAGGEGQGRAARPRERRQAGVILKRVVQIPNSRVGTVIGKQGTTIAQIERMAGVSASVEKAPVRADGEAGAAGELVRLIHLEAHDPAKLSMAEQLIGQLLADQIDGRLLARGIIQPVSKPGSRRV